MKDEERFMKGTFIYDRKTRALVLNGDLESLDERAKDYCWVNVEPDVDGKCGFWQNSVNVPALRLTISLRAETRGLVVMASEIDKLNPMDDINHHLKNQVKRL